MSLSELMNQLKSTNGEKSGLSEQLGLKVESQAGAESDTDAMVAFSQANLNNVNIMKLPDAPKHEIP